MELSLRLGPLAQAKHRGLHGGYHHRIPKLDHGGLKPRNHVSKSREAAVSFEYLFCHPTSDPLRPPA
jgi:hypothetical protein